jgi:transposase
LRISSGRTFGTIIVDLDAHQIIDVLPDRQADTAAVWMAAHPEITHVSRDRGAEYASAASTGAPQAIQVADRFHVCKNLSEAVQRLLARVLSEMKAANQQTEGKQTLKKRPPCPWKNGVQTQERRLRGPLRSAAPSEMHAISRP